MCLSGIPAFIQDNIVAQAAAAVSNIPAVTAELQNLVSSFTIVFSLPLVNFDCLNPASSRLTPGQASNHAHCPPMRSPFAPSPGHVDLNAMMATNLSLYPARRTPPHAIARLLLWSVTANVVPSLRDVGLQCPSRPSRGTQRELSPNAQRARASAVSRAVKGGNAWIRPRTRNLVSQTRAEPLTLVNMIF